MLTNLSQARRDLIYILLHIIKIKRRVFLDKSYKRLSYNSIVIDKLTIEVIEAKERLDPFYSIRGLLVIDYFNILRVNFNPVRTYNKPKVLYTFYLEFVFLNIGL